ncbi:thioredoxin-disulfide reductase [Methylocystis sp. JAN1]|uniref:thioredoxin-disulfide reductase n=1 Tax=Methylocystis sp. JAN1 TaxID=3397211 RepID=UPI003FA224B1
MPAPKHARAIIIGSGPAGYTAAIYTARAMLEPMLIAGFDQGGQLMITTEVENYPGFAEPIQGPWLMEQMRLQAEHVGAKLVSDHIVEARLDKRPFTLVGDSGTVYTCDALIIATGAKAKWLGLPSEEKFKGFGVSACATCDGFFFRGRQVIVVGGGNTAVEEALYLSNLAAHVTIVHRRDEFRSERVLQERLRQRENVSILFNHVVDEIVGAENPLSVTGARLRNVATGSTHLLETDGVFVAIGHAPASELFRGQVNVKPNGYIAVEPGTTRTNIPGVYAAGDVADEVYRQAVTAAGLGCMAALEVEKFLLDAPALAKI